MIRFWQMILVVLSAYYVAAALPPIEWQKTITIPGDQSANRVQQTADGGYILAVSWGIQACLIRTDARGDTVWTRCYGYLSAGAEHVAVLPDGGYVFVGSTGLRLCVIRTDSEGEEIWRYADPDTNQTYGHALATTSTGEIIAVGSIFYAGRRPYEDVYAVKLNADGTVVWTRNWGSINMDEGAFDIYRTSAGYYLIIGSISEQAWHPGLIAYQVNDAGTLLGFHSYVDASGYEIGQAGCELPGGEHIFVGQKYWYAGQRFADFFVDRIFSTGPTRWTWSGGSTSNDEARAVAPGQGGGAVVVGLRDSYTQYPRSEENAWILGFNASGSVQWDTTIGLAGRDAALDIISTADGGYLVTGYRDFMQGLGKDLWFMKLCAEGADAANLQPLATTDSTAAFRLVHQNGSVNRLVLTGFPIATTGWTTGSAALNWTALPNGDGNDGDSVIFTASVPLEAGTVDTFFLATLDSCYQVLWNCGCKTVLISNPPSNTTVLSFAGAQYDHGLVLDLTTRGEVGLSHYEIWARSGSSPYLRIDTLAAYNDTLAQYTVTHHVLYQQYLLRSVNLCGEVRSYPELVLTVGQNLAANSDFAPLPAQPSLSAFPNPFNPATTLSFDLPQTQHVTLAVYDVLGRGVVVLLDDMQTAGTHTVRFDGAALPSGLYFARLQAGSHTATHKLLLLK